MPNFEEKVDRLAKRVQKLEEGNKRLSELLHTEIKRGKENEKEVSRRRFLKKLGTGALGLGALGITSVSGLKLTKNNISSSSGLDFLDSDSNYFKLNNGGPVEVSNTDLRLSTDQAIEDENGTKRLAINTNSTQLRDENGNKAYNAFTSNGDQKTRIHVGNNGSSGSELQILDDLGSFKAVKYAPSSSAPGKLKLTNADIKLESQTKYQMSVSGESSTSSNSGRIVFNSGTGTSVDLYNNGGELTVKDDSGNYTTLS